ncbi:MAG: 5'-3' exonuclease H3TH domain-containing protein, partial [Pseudomonadota bacterium]|nr:5'-3' exonuclease H3TH domain-containing protein [Pseudomonadota bacterium]
IGTIASQIRNTSSANDPNEPRQIQIVSRDKDLAQLLVTDVDCLWDFSANKRRFRVHIEEEFGVSAEQFPDFLGLAGDAADCISGVPGIGAVKAGQLLRKFGTLDEIYRNLDAVAQMKIRGAERLATVLEENRDTAELSRKLATIVCEVDDTDEYFGKVSLSDLFVHTPDLDELRSFLVDYSFSPRESSEIVKQAAQLIKDSSGQAV